MEQKALEQVNAKRLADASSRCARAHNSLLEDIKVVQKCLENVTILYQFCLKWPISTKDIKGWVDSIELQLT